MSDSLINNKKINSNESLNSHDVNWQIQKEKDPIVKGCFIATAVYGFRITSICTVSQRF